MICLDTAVLIQTVRALSEAPPPDDLLRVAEYLRQLRHSDTPIGLPSPVVAEYLVGRPGAAKDNRTIELVGDQLSKDFVILPIDHGAAVLAAKIWSTWERGKAERTPMGVTRQQFKVDLFILAAAELHSAEFLVTPDEHLHRMATECGLSVVATDIPRAAAQLPLPGIDSVDADEAHDEQSH